MEQNGTATKTGYPVSYFDQPQLAAGTATTVTQLDQNNVYNQANYIAYPPTYLYNQQQSADTSIINASSIENTYNQAVTDYATTQYFQQYQTTNQSNKMQTPLKWNTKKKTPYNKPNSQPNIFYCEICKISCAGEQTFKEHCDGQKHRKKEINLKNSTPNSANNWSNGNNSQKMFFCDLCMVPCNGPDAFNAHLNGKAHIKACNLQIKLGKEVPTDLVPLILKCSSQTKNNCTPITMPLNNSNDDNNTVKVIGTPVINFVKGGSLQSMTSDSDAVLEECSSSNNNDNDQQKEMKKVDNNTTTIMDQSSSLDATQINDNNNEMSTSQKTETTDLINNTTININSSNNEIPLLGDLDTMTFNNSSVDLSASSAEPIGLEFITEYNLPNSKAIYYSCSLCNCKFSEINAKEQHVRGKRHHKNYKMKNKKMNQKITTTPTTSENELSPINKSMSNGKLTKRATLKGKPPSFSQLLDKIPLNKKLSPSNQISTSLINQTTNNVYPPMPINQRIDQSMNTTTTTYQLADESTFEENMNISFLDDQFVEPKFDTLDNQYVYKKNSEIVPREDDLKQYYKHIANVERSLKQVSDHFLQDCSSLKDVLIDQPIGNNTRVLQGEIRTGLFGKKLMLRDENQIDLILLCSVKPTVPLLHKLVDVLSTKLPSFEDEKYIIEANIDESAIDVKVANLVIRIVLTSLNIRNVSTDTSSIEPKDPDQMLNKQKCLDALTSLRRFKWYQAKVAPFNPCPMIIRLLRDLTKRVDSWKPLNCWSLELICERIMSNCIKRPSPFGAFKLILQTLASGVLINENKDLILIADPCEIEKIDALGYLTDKEREAITESAQTLVQFIAFNKIHKVLDTEPIEQNENKILDEINNDNHTNNESNNQNTTINCPDGH